LKNKGCFGEKLASKNKESPRKYAIIPSSIQLPHSYYYFYFFNAAFYSKSSFLSARRCRFVRDAEPFWLANLEVKNIKMTNQKNMKER
jgi:hypothetical protein